MKNIRLFTALHIRKTKQKLIALHLLKGIKKHEEQYHFQFNSSSNIYSFILQWSMRILFSFNIFINRIHFSFQNHHFIQNLFFHIFRSSFQSIFSGFLWSLSKKKNLLRNQNICFSCLINRFSEIWKRYLS